MLDFNVADGRDAIITEWQTHCDMIKHIPCGKSVCECTCFFQSGNYGEWYRMVDCAISKLSLGGLSGDQILFDYAGNFNSHVSIGDTALNALLFQCNLLEGNQDD